MKKIIIEQESDRYFTTPSYSDILDSFEFDILLEIEDDDYQGDSRILFRDGRKYGWLQFGWGSCSGCDSLQACDNIEDVHSLQQSLLEDIKWFEDVNEAMYFFNTHDWEGDYSHGSVKQEEFIKQAKEVLQNELIRYLAGVV